jgi:sodium/potassium/calcium exchanger 2
VSSRGLLCSIILLFMMLLVVIITIAISKWRMNKWLGVAMLVFYCIFTALSVLLEYDIIDCPT